MALKKWKDKSGKDFSYLYWDDSRQSYVIVKRIGSEVKKKYVGTDLNEAKKAVMPTIFEWLAEIKSKAPERKIFRDYYELMLLEKEADEIGIATKRRIDAVWKYSLKPFWEFVQPADIDQNKVTEFINWHRSARKGVQLVNAFKYLGNIFSIMVKNEVLSVSRRPELSLPKSEAKHHAEQKGRYIETEEIRRIIDCADPQTRLIVWIGFCSGMRKMEIGKLEKAKIRISAGAYVINLSSFDTKTGLGREIPLPGALNGLIEIQLKNESKYLFPMPSDPKRPIYPKAIDDGWIEAKKRAKVFSKTRFHDLRHTCASNMAKAQINPSIACRILGMSISTYERKYLKLKAADLIIGTEAMASLLARDLS